MAEVAAVAVSAGGLGVGGCWFWLRSAHELPPPACRHELRRLHLDRELAVLMLAVASVSVASVSVSVSVWTWVEREEAAEEVVVVSGQLCWCRCRWLHL